MLVHIILIFHRVHTARSQPYWLGLLWGPGNYPKQYCPLPNLCKWCHLWWGLGTCPQQIGTNWSALQNIGTKCQQENESPTKCSWEISLFFPLEMEGNMFQFIAKSSFTSVANSLADFSRQSVSSVPPEDSVRGEDKDPNSPWKYCRRRQFHCSRWTRLHQRRNSPTTRLWVLQGIWGGIPIPRFHAVYFRVYI